MADIGSSVELREDGTAPCPHVAGLVDNKLASVQAPIRTLPVLEAELEALAERSHRLDPADCPPRSAASPRSRARSPRDHIRIYPLWQGSP